MTINKGKRPIKRKLGAESLKSLHNKTGKEMRKSEALPANVFWHRQETAHSQGKGGDHLF